MVDRLRWLAVQNDTSEAVPAFAAMRVTGEQADGAFTVDKPNRDGQTDLLFNGPLDIPAGLAGQGYRELPASALYEPGDGAPAAGEVWGAQAGNWRLRKGRPGFVVLGGADGTTVDVGPMTARLVSFVQITGPKDATTGLYPAQEMVYRPDSNDWAVGDTVWWKDANG